jgi:hypothetical protein
MSKQQARVVGDVTYREGDGVEMSIPHGPCEIVRDELDATISWTQGATRGSTAIPLSDLSRYLESGDLVLDEVPDE